VTLLLLVKKTDIVNICLGAVEELRAKYPERTIESSVKGNREGFWENARIAQLFSNLIGNGLQHGAQAGPATVHLDCESDEIVATIKNKGAPIDRKKRNPLLNRSFVLRRTTRFVTQMRRVLVSGFTLSAKSSKPTRV
jgi:signal transduction histidine kinase